MNSIQKYAIDIAKEITVSKVSSNTAVTDGAYGKGVADFFEEVYNKIYEIASKDEKN